MVSPSLQYPLGFRCAKPLCSGEDSGENEIKLVYNWDFRFPDSFFFLNFLYGLFVNGIVEKMGCFSSRHKEFSKVKVEHGTQFAGKLFSFNFLNTHVAQQFRFFGIICGMWVFFLLLKQSILDSVGGKGKTNFNGSRGEYFYRLQPFEQQNMNFYYY